MRFGRSGYAVLLLAILLVAFFAEPDLLERSTPVVSPVPPSLTSDHGIHSLHTPRDARISQTSTPLPTNTRLADSRVAAVPDRPSAAALAVERALDTYSSGNVQDGLKALSLAVERYPDQPLPHAAFARLSLVLGDTESALASLDRAASLLPDDPFILLTSSSAFERVGQFGLAMDARRRAQDLVGGWPLTKDGRGLWTLSGYELQPPFTATE